MKATTSEPTARAVRTLMSWHNEDMTQLGAVLGVTRITLHKRLARGLSNADLVTIADHYGVSALDLARGIVPRLAPAGAPTREYQPAAAFALTG